MRTEQPLFRSAAVAAHRHDDLGAIVLARPASFAFLAAFVSVVAGGLTVFACLASYTAHATLQGRVVAEGGVIDVASPQAGTITDRRVSEGQRVAAGDVLLVLSSERLTRSGEVLETAIDTGLEGRRDSLAAQIENTRRLEATEHSALRARRATLAAEAASVAEALTAKRGRLALVERAAERYAELRARGFLADEQWAMREAELLEQRSGVATLEREAAAIERLTAEIAERLDTLRPRYANAIADLERALASNEREIVENDARRATVVTAPQPGTVTGLVADVGQAVPLGAMLARIVPSEPTLKAELLAPSRAVGFVAPGDEVRLRYAAFPYQKFGHSRGKVVAVSAANVASADATRGEPLYRVAVELESQSVTAYGESRRLLPGMAVEADVLLERRRLYEWVFEPLYALGARAR